MMDLLRVYGTLCWNLSQITGRKDIPMIHMTYSPKAANKENPALKDGGYLRHLDNQREELKNAILQAPCHRLDNLASFVETHGERLAHLLEALIGFRKNVHRFYLKTIVSGLLSASVIGISAFLAAMLIEPLASMALTIQAGAASLLGGSWLLVWLTFLRKAFYARFHRKQLENMDDLTPLNNQTRRDAWESIRDLVYVNLKRNSGRFATRDVKYEYLLVKEISETGSKEIREALKELASLSPDELADLHLSATRPYAAEFPYETAWKGPSEE